MNKKLLLYYLLIPYYLILPLLNDFQKTIKNAYQKNKKLHSISLLLSGCINELFDSIRERVRQEIYTHIYFALLNYYQNKDLILKESLFIKNLCDPSEISSLHVALQAKYKQNNLFDDSIVPVNDLKEEVSKVNTKKKMILINNVKKILIANFDKNERDDFEDKLVSYIEKLPNIDNYNKERLITMYFNELHSCLESINNKKKNDGYSYVFSLTEKSTL